MQGGGSIEVPVTAKSALKPRNTFGLSGCTGAYDGSQYTCQTGANDQCGSNAYCGKECPARPPVSGIYPLGAPPLGMHQGAPAPTGFQGV